MRRLFPLLIVFLTGFGCSPPGPETSFTVRIPSEDQNRVQAAEQIVSGLKRGLSLRGKQIRTEIASDRIEIIVPAREAELTEMILKLWADNSGTFSLRLVHPDSPQPASAVDGQNIPGYQPQSGPEEDEITLVSKESEFTAVDVKRADAAYGPQGWEIQVQLTAEAGNRMFRYSDAHIGDQMAIVVGPKVISAPVIQSQFGANFQISGNFSEAEARNLTAIIATPELPFEIEVVSGPDEIR